METPKITANRVWTTYNVRQVCIDEHLYTKGDCEDYDRMLTLVSELTPTYENLYRIAKDICEHSVDQTITNVMYLLEKRAIYTTFELNGDDNA